MFPTSQRVLPTEGTSLREQCCRRQRCPLPQYGMFSEAPNTVLKSKLFVNYFCLLKGTGFLDLTTRLRSSASPLSCELTAGGCARTPARELRCFGTKAAGQMEKLPASHTAGEPLSRTETRAQVGCTLLHYPHNVSL